MESKSNVPDWIREEAVTDCTDVHEFAHKYRRPERFTAQGESYVQTIIDK